MAAPRREPDRRLWRAAPSDPAIGFLKSKLRLALPAAVLAVSVLGALPAHAADRVIASSPGGVSPVKAYGGNVVWGEDNVVGRSGPAYFVRDARGTRPLPLEDRVRRVDLGARRGGGTRAVFVRCRPLSTRQPVCRLRSFAVDRGRFFYITNNKVWEATDPPLSFTR